jgi:uncharacterized membrane protein
MKQTTINCIKNEFQKLNINIHSFSHVNIILIIISSFIGSIGLLTNNYQTVIASKIIGLALIPFISLSIIILTGDIKLISNSLGKCILFIFLCLLVGIILGFINSYNNYVTEPTSEMMSRANFKYHKFGLELLVSIVAGVGVYYSIIKTSIIALIGIILVVSIIPPICNAGLLYGMSLHNYIQNNLEKHNTYITYANNSFMLFLVNITGVFLGFISAFVFNCISFYRPH